MNQKWIKCKPDLVKRVVSSVKMLSLENGGERDWPPSWTQVQCDRCSNRDLYKGPQGLRDRWGAEPGFGRQGSLPMASVHGKICTYGMVMEIYAGVCVHVCTHTMGVGLEWEGRVSPGRGSIKEKVWMLKNLKSCR